MPNTALWVYQDSFGFIRIPLWMHSILSQNRIFHFQSKRNQMSSFSVRCLLLFWVQLAEICGDKSYKTSFWVWSSDMDFSTLLFMLVTNLVSVWWDKKEDEHPCLCCLWVRCHCCLTISKTVQTFFCGRRPLYHRIILSHGN